MPLALAIASVAQVENAPDQREADQRQQMQFFKEQAAQHQLFRPPTEKSPLSLKADPVLRYSNPAGLSSDGATFLWLEGELPVAAISFSLRRPNNAAFRECTSFSSTPFDCRVGDNTVWAPKKGGLLASKLEPAPVPAESETRRLTQMRDLVRRFSVTRHHSRTEDKTQLSVRPSPLYRYSSEKYGIIDGGLFTFGDSNDPDMLLLVEAFREKSNSPPYWRYSLA